MTVVLDKESRRARQLKRAGYAMTGTGAVITLLFPTIFNFIVGSQLVVKEGNIFTPIWKAPPIGVPIKLFIFSIQNPKEFMNGAKADLKQMGPYVYDLYMSRDIDKYSDDGETIIFYDNFKWLYNQELSGGRPTDRLTIINPATFIGYTAVQDLLDLIPFSTLVSPVVQNMLNAFFAVYNESLIKEVTAGQLINGYKFPIMDLVDTAVIKPLEWLGVDLPPERLPENKMGILNIINMTNRRGPYEMYTGQGGGEAMTYKYWHGKPTLDSWDDPECDAIRGSTLIHFGNFLNKESKVWFFFGDFCRSFYLTFKEERMVSGVPTYYFHMPEAEFAGPKRNPENKCFCKLKEKDKCDGIYHLGGCYFNAPIAFSYPHFLYASEKMQTGVEGLNPDVDKHEFGLYLEPHAGVIIKTAVRLQVNFLMRPVSFASNLGKIPETTMPWVWIETDFGLDKLGPLLQGLAIVGLYPLVAIDYGAGPALAVGGLGALYMARRINKKKARNVEKGVSNINSTYPTRKDSPIQPMVQNFMTNPKGGNVSYNGNDNISPIKYTKDEIGKTIYPDLLGLKQTRMDQEYNGNKNEGTIKNGLSAGQNVYAISDRQFSI